MQASTLTDISKPSEVADRNERNRFEEILENRGLELRRTPPKILQLNIGKLCNLTCIHCHVNAGPKRKELMTRATIDRILEWLARTDLDTVDITGGSPEMNPEFRYLVDRLRALPNVKTIMDRCNVTILLEKSYEWVADFLASREVEIIASMPCYSPENVNEQRGEGVFDKSIAALKLLNGLGYGTGRNDHPLHLVYNPNGAFLPGDQEELECDYKRELGKHFGITFDQLYTIANVPIARFAAYLRRTNQYEAYLDALRDAFNPATLPGLMCRDTINVGWDGRVYDCDFNQMIDLTLEIDGAAAYVWELDTESLAGRSIRTGDHCFACAAGNGSSCGGALV